MSTAENKALARRFIEVWNRGGTQLLDELAAPELVVSYPLLPADLHGPACATVSQLMPQSTSFNLTSFPSSDTICVCRSFRGHSTSCVEQKARQRDATGPVVRSVLAVLADG